MYEECWKSARVRKNSALAGLFIFLALTPVVLVSERTMVKATASEKRRALIDNDFFDREDVIGLLMAIQSPDLVVEGLTVVAGVIPDVEVASTCVLKLLELVRRTDIPVAQGMNRPLKGKIVFPEEWTQDLLQVWKDMPPPKIKMADTHAVDLIISKIMSSPGEITVLAAGPLTNIATALQREPRIVKNIDELIVMGGTTLPAVDAFSRVPGASEVAEWNMFTDPEAAKIVFDSGMKITMVGLNVCEKAMLTVELYERIRAQNSVVSNLITNMFEHFYESSRVYGEKVPVHPLWDTLAMAVCMERSVVETKRFKVNVVTEGPDAGKTVLVSEATDANVNVCLSVNAQNFYDLILKLLEPYSYVGKPLDTTLLITPVPPVPEGSPVVISSTLKDENGLPISNKTVEFYADIGGMYQWTMIGSSVTDRDGVASISYTPKMGERITGKIEIWAIYRGDWPRHRPSDAKLILTVTTRLDYTPYLLVAVMGVATFASIYLVSLVIGRRFKRKRSSKLEAIKEIRIHLDRRLSEES